MGRPADLVERIVALGYERLDESLALMSERARWTPRPCDPPLEGHEEIRGFVAAELRRLGPDVPEALPALLFERGGTVLVLGQLRVPRREGKRRFTEMRPIAWIYDIEGDLVVSVTAYDDWELAREAAGVPAGMTPTRTLKASLWHPIVARLPRVRHRPVQRGVGDLLPARP